MPDIVTAGDRLEIERSRRYMTRVWGRHTRELEAILGEASTPEEYADLKSRTCEYPVPTIDEMEVR